MFKENGFASAYLSPSIDRINISRDSCKAMTLMTRLMFTTIMCSLLFKYKSIRRWTCWYYQLRWRGSMSSSFGTIYRNFNFNVQWEKRSFGIAHLESIYVMTYPVMLMKRAVIGKPHTCRIYFIVSYEINMWCKKRARNLTGKNYYLRGVGNKRKR